MDAQSHRVEVEVAPDLIEIDDWAIEGPSKWAEIGRSLNMWVPIVFLVGLAATCFLWPEIYTIPNPVKGNVLAANLPPFSAHHLFGTDSLGDDVFSRILYGGRVSLVVGLGSTALGMVIGGLIGSVAGYAGGLLETVVMRLMDMLLAFPSLVLAIIVATYLGPSELHVIWAIAFFSIPAFARLSRGGALRLREQTFVTAGRITGASNARVVVRHVVPNIVPEMMTFGLLNVGIAIVVAAALSFLGLGVPPPSPSWGDMIAQGQQYLTTNPALILIPAAFIFATTAALNTLGDALRERWALEM